MERDGGGRPRAQVQGRGQRRSGLFLCQPPPPLPCRGHMTPPVLRSCAVIVETLHLGDCSTFDVDVIPMLPKSKLSTSWLQHESRDNGRLLTLRYISFFWICWTLIIFIMCISNVFGQFIVWLITFNPFMVNLGCYDAICLEFK